MCLSKNEFSYDLDADDAEL